VDRLIAVAASVLDMELSFLRVMTSFEEAIRTRRRDMGPDETEPGGLWTASIITIRIVRPEHAR
jgi:hypothetical protein